MSIAINLRIMATISYYFKDFDFFAKFLSFVFLYCFVVLIQKDSIGSLCKSNQGKKKVIFDEFVFVFGPRFIALEP